MADRTGSSPSCSSGLMARKAGGPRLLAFSRPSEAPLVCVCWPPRPVELWSPPMSPVPDSPRESCCVSAQNAPHLPSALLVNSYTSFKTQLKCPLLCESSCQCTDNCSSLARLYVCPLLKLKAQLGLSDQRKFRAGRRCRGTGEGGVGGSAEGQPEQTWRQRWWPG